MEFLEHWVLSRADCANAYPAHVTLTGWYPHTSHWKSTSYFPFICSDPCSSAKPSKGSEPELSVFLSIPYSRFGSPVWCISFVLIFARSLWQNPRAFSLIPAKGHKRKWFLLYIFTHFLARHHHRSIRYHIIMKGGWPIPILSGKKLSSGFLLYS